MMHGASEGGCGWRRAGAWAVFGILPALLFGDFVVRGAAGPRVRRPAESYLGRLALTPVQIAGPWWRRHRRWLKSPTPVHGAGRAIVNLRTGAAYNWTFKGNHGGNGWFGVSTRWAWFHPRWADDPWALLYDAAIDDLRGQPSRCDSRLRASESNWRAPASTTQRV
jgi:hypothetical protein